MAYNGLYGPHVERSVAGGIIVSTESLIDGGGLLISQAKDALT